MKAFSITRNFRVLCGLLIAFIVLLWGLWTYYSPMFQTGAKIQEGTALSTPARAVFDTLCQVGKLRTGLRHDDPEVGLANPNQYEGNLVSSVSFSTPAPNIGMVVVVFKQFRTSGLFGLGKITQIEKGATWIYRGICLNTKVTWSIDSASTVRKKYWPKL